MSEPEQIAEAIETICRRAAPEPVYGSTLGHRLSKLFGQSIAFKDAHGGLRNFVEQHCGGKVVWLGKKGSNDIFTLSPELSSEVSPAIKNFWRTFSNPASSGKLFVNTDAGTLKVLPPTVSAPAQFLEVAKVTSEEQLEYVRKFLSQIQENDRPHFAPLLEDPNYWFKWTQALSTLAIGQYHGAWVEFREAEVIGIFHRRLKQLELSEDLISFALIQLRGIQSPSSQTKPATDYLGHSTQHELRSLVQKIISNLNEEDLRGLRLPLGAILDALKRS